MNHAASNPQVPGPSGASRESDADLADATILLVDDNAVNRQVVKLFLAQLSPKFVEAVNGQEALDRLRQAIGRFRGWSGPLQPHFAYGALDKAGYERAHAMHLANHFSAFDVRRAG